MSVSVKTKITAHLTFIGLSYNSRQMYPFLKYPHQNELHQKGTISVKHWVNGPFYCIVTTLSLDITIDTDLNMVLI